VASLFRGHALDWLARQYKLQPQVLADFAAFRTLINKTWGYSDETLQLINERELIRLRAASGHIKDFSARFEVVASSLELGNVTKKLLYSAKLPLDLQDRVIIGEEPDDYEELVTAAKRVDEQLKAIGHGRAPPGASPSRKDKRKNKSKSTPGGPRAGPTIKAEINMISVRVVGDSASPSERTTDIRIGGRSVVARSSQS
jgi:hypothetical protein